MKNTFLIHEEWAVQRHGEFQKTLGDRVIAVGEYAKIAFKEEGKITERMWVRITEVCTQYTFVGVLDNDPVNLTNVACGDGILFNRTEIEQLIQLI